jgi:DNA processing protein
MPLPEIDIAPLLLVIRATACQPRLARRLLTRFDSAGDAVLGFRAALHAQECDIKYGTAIDLQARLQDPQHAERVQRDLEWLKAPDHYFLSPGSSAYPGRLQEIDDPPLGLFSVGDISLLARPQLAVVGSRQPSRYGRQVATGLVKELSLAGLIITSGMARGIDGIAHRACLEVGGATIAVLGTGLDQVYPREHKTLQAEIGDQGLVVSEFPLGTGVEPHQFPQRNRLVTGLSLGTLIIEARHRSGSLISARLAMEQGREVFAVPGSIHSKLSEGCHKLLRDGATLAGSVEDILSELPDFVPCLPGMPDATSSLSLSSLQVDLLKVLDLELQSCDRLAARLLQPAGEILGALVRLEVQGLVRSQAGGYSLVERWPIPNS